LPARSRSPALSLRLRSWIKPPSTAASLNPRRVSRSSRYEPVTPAWNNPWKASHLIFCRAALKACRPLWTCVFPFRFRGKPRSHFLALAS
jgi:hypothetical protein